MTFKTFGVGECYRLPDCPSGFWFRPTRLSFRNYDVIRWP